jgi:hypothetical protein
MLKIRQTKQINSSNKYIIKLKVGMGRIIS